jgi:tetratricopeptide (TPR) repeat protein
MNNPYKLPVLSLTNNVSLCNLLDIDKNELEKLYATGFYYFSRNKFIQAYEYFYKLTYLDPYEPKYMKSIGITCQMLGKHEEALVFFYAYNDLMHSNVVDIFFNIGESLLFLNKKIEAYDSFVFVIENSSNKYLKQSAKQKISLMENI